MKTDDRGAPRCDVCGDPGISHPVTVNFTLGGVTAYCSFCQGLMDAGYIRLDSVDRDGTPRFRRWENVWTARDLVPRPPEPEVRP